MSERPRDVETQDMGFGAETSTEALVDHLASVTSEVGEGIDATVERVATVVDSVRERSRLPEGLEDQPDAEIEVRPTEQPVDQAGLERIFKETAQLVDRGEFGSFAFHGTLVGPISFGAEMKRLIAERAAAEGLRPEEEGEVDLNGIDLSGVKIQGDLSITCPTLVKCDLSGAVIEGNVELRQVDIFELRFRNTKITGNLELQQVAHLDDETGAEGGHDFRGLEVGGYILIVFDSRWHNAETCWFKVDDRDLLNRLHCAIPQTPIILYPSQADKGTE